MSNFHVVIEIVKLMPDEAANQPSTSCLESSPIKGESRFEEFAVREAMNTQNIGY